MSSGLDLFPSGVRRARKGIYEVEKQMMTGNLAGQRGRRKILEARERETLLQLKTVVKDIPTLYLN